MNVERPVWGIHMPESLGTKPIDEGFIAIGWHDVGNLSRFGADREAIKFALREAIAHAKPGAIAPWAGILLRFANEMAPGDIVVYPSKADRMINIGVIEGAYTYSAAFDPYPNRRSVRWQRHVPRADFPQSALNEIGSALTLFQVTTHADEFLAALDGRTVTPDETDDEAAEAVSAQVVETTEDFILGSGLISSS